MALSFQFQKLLSCLSGEFDGSPSQSQNRHLSDLRECYRDNECYEALLGRDDPVVYSTYAPKLPSGDGDLNFAVAVLSPGQVGDEFFMTKGHLHSWREAAEIYVGLGGEGAMLLEDEATGESKLVTLKKDELVYVSGHTMHRTVNTGDVPLFYVGIYPAKAGHDYAAIINRNFRCKVIADAGEAKLVERV